MEEELKQRLFEIMSQVDELSCKKDYEGLRKLHYESCDWVNRNGMGDDYYKYFCKNHLHI